MPWLKQRLKQFDVDALDLAGEQVIDALNECPSDAR